MRSNDAMQLRSSQGHWHHWLRRSIAFGLALSMLLLSACSPEQFRTEAADVPRIVESILSDPKTFNYIGSDDGVSTSVLGFLYEGLLSTNGVTGELEPGLAESWEISPDQKTITYKLREGLKWSDGVPITVDDITFTYNDVIFNPKIPSSNADILRVGEQGLFPTVRKVDDRRVQFIAPEPFAPLLRFAGGAFLPKHVLQEFVNATGADGNSRFLAAWGTDTDPQKIVGNGPYVIKSYAPSQRLILERNPYYWRKDAQGNPQPHVRQYVLQVIESTDASLTQFRSGGLDIESITPEYFSLIKREADRGNFTIYNGGPALSSQYLTFNMNQGRRNGKPLVDPVKSKWFNMLEFRQAIAYGMDRDTMINNIYQGLGVPQHSPIYIQSPFYFSPEEGLPTYEFNLEKARQLLQQAGFKLNDRQELFDSDGNRVRFTLITNAGNKIREAMGSQLKRDLAKLGIQVDFQPIAFNTLIQRSDSGDWESILLGFAGAGVEPDGGRNIWSPDGRLHMFNQAPAEGQPPLEGRVVADWEAEIGRLFVKGSQELDEEKRKQIYAEIQKMTQRYIPFIFLVNPLSLAAVRNRIENVKFSALGGATWNVHELQLSDE